MSEFIVIKDHGMGFFEVSNCAGATYGMFNLEVTAQRLRDQLNAGLAAQAEIERLQAENERLKDMECDLITGLEKDKKLLLDQMTFLLTATMGGHLSKDDHDALVMDSIKIIEGMTYMPFTSYVHVIEAGG